MVVTYNINEKAGGRGLGGRAYVFLLAILALPAALSPTHPIAVYAYLADTYIISLLDTSSPETLHDVAEFLISPKQLESYRVALRADLRDRRGGAMFAIVREPAGDLRHEPLRTWNSFLPEDLPDWMTLWLDRKEWPYLGNTVGLWLAGDEMVAVGHYHPFGGGPSKGDLHAQKLSRYAEVVVSNGVVPLVYLEGEVIPFGRDVEVPYDVYRKLRALERGLLMEVKDVPVMPSAPSEAMASALAYLRDYRGADLSQAENLAQTVSELCLEFKQDYSYIFSDGFGPSAYEDDTDVYNMLNNLMNVEYWASCITRMQAGRSVVVSRNYESQRAAQGTGVPAAS